jgi:hypothetical protein
MYYGLIVQPSSPTDGWHYETAKSGQGPTRRWRTIVEWLNTFQAVITVIINTAWVHYQQVYDRKLGSVHPEWRYLTCPQFLHRNVKKTYWRLVWVLVDAPPPRFVQWRAPNKVSMFYSRNIARPGPLCCGGLSKTRASAFLVSLDLKLDSMLYCSYVGFWNPKSRSWIA